MARCAASRSARPVDFNGVQVGEVVAINIEYDPAQQRYRYPVEAVVYQERIRSRYRAGSVQPRSNMIGVHPFMARLIEHGLRAQLNTGSLLTGQQVVSMMFFPKAKPAPPIRAATRWKSRRCPAASTTSRTR